jgi:hypothetical protein
MAVERRNASMASSYQKECRAATPRRKWAWAFADPEVGNSIVPNFPNEEDSLEGVEDGSVSPRLTCGLPVIANDTSKAGRQKRLQVYEIENGFKDIPTPLE